MYNYLTRDKTVLDGYHMELDRYHMMSVQFHMVFVQFHLVFVQCQVILQEFHVTSSRNDGTFGGNIDDGSVITGLGP